MCHLPSTSGVLLCESFFSFLEDASATIWQPRVRKCTNVLLIRAFLIFTLNIALFFFKVDLLFTTLHGMQTRSSDENSVCLSVRPSARPSLRPSDKPVDCDKTEEQSV